MHEAPKNVEGYKEKLAGLYQLLKMDVQNVEEAIQFPLIIAGNNITVSVFGILDNKLEFGLFVGDKKYSRKTLRVGEEGSVEEDTVGTIPDFDKTTHEPDFSSQSDEEIAFQVLSKFAEILPSSFVQ